MTLSVSVLFQSLLTGYPVLSKSPVTPHAPKTVLPQPGGEVGPGKAAVSAANSLTKGSLKAAMANSSSSDSSDSDTDDNQVAANHKAGGSPLARLGICLALEQSCAGTGGGTGDGGPCAQCVSAMEPQHGALLPSAGFPGHSTAFTLNSLLVLAASKAQCLCLFQDVL